MAYYTNQQLDEMGLKSFGKNVFISNKSTIINPGNIVLGDNVRIDDYCIISAGADGIEIGSYVHIAPYVSIQGASKVVLNDFCGLSSRVAIYSSTDDYSGNFLTNPTVPEKYTNVMNGEVILEKHVIVGAGSVLLPDTTLEIGVAIGALSLVNGKIQEWSIAIGVPAKKIKRRYRNILELEKKLIESLVNE